MSKLNSVAINRIASEYGVDTMYHRSRKQSDYWTNFRMAAYGDDETLLGSIRWDREEYGEYAPTYTVDDNGNVGTFHTTDFLYRGLPVTVFYLEEGSKGYLTDDDGACLTWFGFGERFIDAWEALCKVCQHNDRGIPE